MELRYEGVLYHFDYDFYPNYGTLPFDPVVLAERCELDGAIVVHSITVNGKPRQVSPELRAIMWRAAALEAISADLQSWIAAYQKVGQKPPSCLLKSLETVSRLG